METLEAKLSKLMHTALVGNYQMQFERLSNQVTGIDEISCKAIMSLASNQRYEKKSGYIDRLLGSSYRSMKID